MAIVCLCTIAAVAAAIPAAASPTTTAVALARGYDRAPGLCTGLKEPVTADARQARSARPSATSADRFEGPSGSSRLSTYARFATEAAATSGGIETTAHGATRVAGAGATRGGVLNEAEIAVVRGSGATYTQSNGAIARILQQADGRFSVVVDGERGLITTFQNLSQNSLERLAKNYGWDLP